MVSTSLWVEPYVLLHYGFHRSTKGFWLKNIKYLLTGILAIGLTWLCAAPFELPLIATMGVRILLCLIIPNVVFLLFSFKSPEFHSMANMLKSTLKR